MIIGISGRIGSGKDTLAAALTKAIVNKASHNWSQFVEELAPGQLQRVSGWQIKRFADPVKDIVCMLIGCTREQLEDREFKESELGSEWARPMKALGFMAGGDTRMCYPKEQPDLLEPLTVRKLLQLVGTDAGRQVIHPDIWVNAMFAQYRSVYIERVEDRGYYPNWIIPDVRFPNEADRIKQHGGIVIRVNRYPTTLLEMSAGFNQVEVPFDPSNRKHMDLYRAEATRLHPSETALDNYEGFDSVIENTGTLEGLYEKAKDIVKQFKLTDYDNAKSPRGNTGPGTSGPC